MSKQDTLKSFINQIPSQTMDLMLDVVLEVMQAENGSIMLLDSKRQNLTIQSARGLKNEIIRKTRVRLGNGVSGKVASTGKSVFLKGIRGEPRLNIKPDDLINPEIDTSYTAPIRLHDQTLGIININSNQPNHEIRVENERQAQGILRRFSEYLAQIEHPLNYQEEPSQLYMMNIFREYNTLRELRVVFDFIFHLITDLLKAKGKGVFLLKNLETGFFDLLLGYGFDTKQYQNIYEELVPILRQKKVETIRSITIFNRNELLSGSEKYFLERFYVLIPFVWQNNIQAQILVFSDKLPALDETTEPLFQSVCEAGGRAIENSVSGQKFCEMTHTDSLTGTYNYGLWWKRLKEEFSRAQRIKDTEISVIIFDIDHFDHFNRANGYFVGDQLLRLIGDRIKSSLRAIDIVGRIGGEEFGVVLPDTTKQKALRVADRILDAISGLPSEMHIQLSKPLTLSGGIAAFPNDADTPEKLMEQAKTARVSAKIMGGNCIKSFEHLEE